MSCPPWCPNMTPMDLFIELFAGLPRQGPGNEPCTSRALAAARPHLPEHPVVLDLGCGSGSSTRVLAKALEATIFAVDLEPRVIAQLRDEAPRIGRSTVLPVLADFSKLPEGLPDEAVPADLIWSEGAAYNLSFEGALTAWAPLLREGGVLALSECCWLSEDRDPDAVQLFEAEYPSMLSAEELDRRAVELGWELVEAFNLPDAAWLDAFYEPMEQRIAELRWPWADGPGEAVLDGAQAEIDLWRRTKSCWGYRFLVLRKTS